MYASLTKHELNGYWRGSPFFPFCVFFCHKGTNPSVQLAIGGASNMLMCDRVDILLPFSLFKVQLARWPSIFEERNARIVNW